MKYIDALKLINLCLEEKILHEKEKHVCVYKGASNTYPEGWYLVDKYMLAHELMRDEKGQNILMSKLKEKEIDFVPTKF